MIREGEVLFWTPDAPDAADLARTFTRSRGLTADDVKLVKRAHNGRAMVMVIARAGCRNLKTT